VVLCSEIDPLYFLSQRLREAEEQLRALNANSAHCESTDAKTDAPTQDASKASLAANACEALRADLIEWARTNTDIRKLREPAPSFASPGNSGSTRYRDRIAVECHATEPLIEIGRRLLERNDLNQYHWSQIVGFVLDAAEPYYRSVWELCSREERLVLIQLAQEGLLNPCRIELVRRLSRRGLVVVDPRFKLMNESFAQFVRTVESPERVAEWEHTASGLSWSRLGTPLYALAAVVIIILLFTEQDMLSGVLAIATAAGSTLSSFRSLYSAAIKPTLGAAKLA
jgi:hypothetical protein